MALLIPLCFLLLFFVLNGRCSFGFGHAFATSIIAVFLWVVISTNLLSLVSGLTFWPVVLCWVVPCLVLLTQIRHVRNSARTLLMRIKAIAKRQPVLFWFAFSLCALFALGTFFSAVLYPVSNGDSLATHLPRVFFAIQSRSIAPYPTSVITQLITYPLSFWTITHVVVLSRSSYFAVNLVQWACYVPASFMCVLIARKMRANSRGQVLTLLAALTVSGAILQASVTLYDLVLAVVMLVAIYFTVCYLTTPDEASNKYFIFPLGIALGVALIAKITTVPLFFPFFLWLILAIKKRTDLKTMFVRVATIVALAAVVASPWFVRNALIFNDDILLSHQAPAVSIPDKTPGAVWANMWRAVFMEFSTPLPQLNHAIERVAGVVGGALGTPITSTVNSEYGKYRFALSPYANIHSDRQASPFTWSMILVGTLYVFFRRRPPFFVRPYALCALGGFLLTGTLITWQPFLARTLTPALLVGTPLIGVITGELFMRQRAKAWMMRAVFSALLAGSLALGGLTLLFNRTNPLMPDAWLGLPAPYALGWWGTPREELAYQVTTPAFGPAIDELRACIDARPPGSVLFVGDRVLGPQWPLLQLFPPNTVVSQEGASIDPSSERFVAKWPKKTPDLIVSQDSQKPESDVLVRGGVTFTRYRTVFVAARPDYGIEAQWITLWMRT